MDHNINWTATAFAGRNYNDIIFIGGNRVGTGYFRNVGNTQRMGTEVSLNGKLGKKWTWYGNYSYVRASFETHQKISSGGHAENTYTSLCEGSDDMVQMQLVIQQLKPIKSFVKLKNPIKYRLVQGNAIPGVSPHLGRLGIGYQPNEAFSMFIDAEYNSEQFYRGDENNAQGIKVPGYWLLNASAEYDMSLSKNDSVRSVFFIEGRNLLNENYETGGILAENEVEGTGGSGIFVTPGSPFLYLVECIFDGKFKS